jgi:pantothenate kinase
VSRPLTSRDWLGKSSAGLLLGFLIALGLSGIFKIAAGVGDTYFSTKGQLGMWMMAPIWAGVLSFCFLFPSTRSAWGWLGLASGVLWGTLALLTELAS